MKTEDFLNTVLAALITAIAIVAVLEWARIGGAGPRAQQCVQACVPSAAP
jgi:hypothetical protein